MTGGAAVSSLSSVIFVSPTAAAGRAMVQESILARMKSCVKSSHPNSTMITGSG